jgi:hypothetical protein
MNNKFNLSNIFIACLAAFAMNVAHASNSEINRSKERQNGGTTEVIPMIDASSDVEFAGRTLSKTNKKPQLTPTTATQKQASAASSPSTTPKPSSASAPAPVASTPSKATQKNANKASLSKNPTPPAPVTAAPAAPPVVAAPELTKTETAVPLASTTVRKPSAEKRSVKVKSQKPVSATSNAGVAKTSTPSKYTGVGRVGNQIRPLPDLSKHQAVRIPVQEISPSSFSPSTPVVAAAALGSAAVVASNTTFAAPAPAINVEVSSTSVAQLDPVVVSNKPVTITEVISLDTISLVPPTKEEPETVALPRPPVVAKVLQESPSASVATSSKIESIQLGASPTSNLSSAISTLPVLEVPREHQEKHPDIRAGAIKNMDVPPPAVPLFVPVEKESTPPIATTTQVREIPTFANQQPAHVAPEHQVQRATLESHPIADSVTFPLPARQHKVANPKFPGLPETGEFIAFDPGSSKVNADTASVLRDLVQALRSDGIRRLVLVGTALRDEDSEGLESSEFAMRRAKNLSAALKNAGFTGTIKIDAPKRAKQGTTPRVMFTTIR